MNPSKPERNPRRKTSGGSNDGEDRLSYLPDHIIHYIFSFLETIDIVRARALSKKWKSVWISTPYLNFDIDSLPDKEQFKNFVNYVLISQNWSINIQRFHICCFDPSDDFAFYEWMSVAAGRNVEELRLSFFSPDADVEKRFGPVELPNCLVTCDSLVKLSIEFCVLHPPTDTGFTLLKSLILRFVTVNDSSLFQNFISNCPLVENLILDSCHLFFKEINISSLSLKILEMRSLNFCPYFRNDGVLLATRVFKIACPNLVSFTYTGLAAFLFNFENLNSLQNVRIRLMDTFRPTPRKCCRIMSAILNGIRSTKVLDLWQSNELHHVLADPKCFSASFNNLTSLSLTTLDMKHWDMHLILNFLKCSPNLKALTVLFFGRCESPDNWIIPDETIPCLTCHLKEVKLVFVEGSENELEFIRFLLRNGHVLQELSIKWSSRVALTMKFVTEIMNFPRSSPNVALRFL